MANPAAVSAHGDRKGCGGTRHAWEPLIAEARHLISWKFRSRAQWGWLKQGSVAKGPCFDLT